MVGAVSSGAGTEQDPPPAAPAPTPPQGDLTPPPTNLAQPTPPWASSRRITLTADHQQQLLDKGFVFTPPGPDRMVRDEYVVTGRWISDKDRGDRRVLREERDVQRSRADTLLRQLVDARESRDVLQRTVTELREEVERWKGRWRTASADHVAVRTELTRVLQAARGDMDRLDEQVRQETDRAVQAFNAQTQALLGTQERLRQERERAGRAEAALDAQKVRIHWERAADDRYSGLFDAAFGDLGIIVGASLGGGLRITRIERVPS